MTTLERIAAVMGCSPENDDDFVEAVRLLVAKRDDTVALKKELLTTRTSSLAQSNAATVLLAGQSSLREERNAAVAARDALTEEVEQLRASHATLILLVDRLAADRRQLYTRLREVMPWVGYCPFNASQAREMFLSRDFASDTLKEVSLDLDRAEIVSTSVVVKTIGDDDGKDDQ